MLALKRTMSYKGLLKLAAWALSRSEIGLRLCRLNKMLAFLLFRYLFNAGEGFQRFCLEHKVRMSRLSSCLLTRLTPDASGGLPGKLRSTILKRFAGQVAEIKSIPTSVSSHMVHFSRADSILEGSNDPPSLYILSTS